MILIFTLILATVLTIVTFYKRSFQHWKNKGLKNVKPSIPFGSLGNPYTRKKHVSQVLKDIYDEYRTQGLKHIGLYAMYQPVYMPLNLDYIRNIMTKDFAHFVNRGVYYNEDDDPISAHLFSIEGSKWRNLRMKLTPTFTSGKMKMMFPTLVECSKVFKKVMDVKISNNQAIDIKEELGRFTTDIIGICAFGLECQTLEKEDSPFRKHGKAVFELDRFGALKQFFAFSYRDLARKLHIRNFPKDSADFFMEIVKDNIHYREQNNITRNDFFQILIDLKNKKFDNDITEEHDGKSLTIEEFAAQCFVFFAAGFETSSTTMTFALYEMSRKQEIQEKAREEVKRVLAKYDEEMTYEAIQEMKYLGQIIDETLRLYPPVPTLDRKCNKDYKLPDCDLVISKGTKVMIPIYAIQRDEEYFPNPEDFDPERFSEENKKVRHAYAHLPFGEGPRNCIGMRFGLMQTKVGLALLLKNYKFTLDKKTDIPMKISPVHFILTPHNTVLLRGEHI